MRLLKMITSLFLSAVIALASCTVGIAVRRPYFRGDVNDDGAYTMDDVIMIQKNLANITEFSLTNKLTADANGNGIIEMSDVTLLQKVIARLLIMPDQEISGARMQSVHIRIDESCTEFSIGKPVKFIGKANGGVEPYSYEFYVNDEIAVRSDKSDILEYTFDMEGIYRIKVVARDALNQEREYCCDYDPTVGFTKPQYITLSIDKSKGEPQLGKPVKFVANVSGGYAPYQYEFYFGNTKIREKGEDNTFEYTMDHDYSYIFNVLVYDSNGNRLGNEFSCYGSTFVIVRTSNNVEIVNAVPDT